MELLDVYWHQLLVFLLVLTRISGLILSAPVFGPRSVPLPARVFLAVSLALIVTPLQSHAAVAAPGTLVELAAILAREAALGLALGMALTIFFAGMHLAGNIMGQMSGLQLADVFDPSFDSQVPVFGQLLDLVAMGVFVALGGHRKVVAALLDTFRWRPPGADDLPPAVTDAMIGVLTESFVVGIRAGAPVMVALLLAVVILGLVGRTLPQLNVFAVGFNLNALVLLVTLACSLSTVSQVVDQRTDAMLGAVRDVLGPGTPFDP
jgi:flagellar biosynthetic protein FliR